MITDMETGSVVVPIGESNWNNIGGIPGISPITETIPIRVIDLTRTIGIYPNIGAGVKDSQNITYVSKDEAHIVDRTKDALIHMDWR